MFLSLRWYSPRPVLLSQQGVQELPHLKDCGSCRFHSYKLSATSDAHQQQHRQCLPGIAQTATPTAQTLAHLQIAQSLTGQSRVCRHTRQTNVRTPILRRNPLPPRSTDDARLVSGEYRIRCVQSSSFVACKPFYSDSSVALEFPDCVLVRPPSCAVANLSSKTSHCDVVRRTIAESTRYVTLLQTGRSAEEYWKSHDLRRASAKLASRCPRERNGRCCRGGQRCLIRLCSRGTMPPSTVRRSQ